MNLSLLFLCGLGLALAVALSEFLEEPAGVRCLFWPPERSQICSVGLPQPLSGSIFIHLLDYELRVCLRIVILTKASQGQLPLWDTCAAEQGQRRPAVV